MSVPVNKRPTDLVEVCRHLPKDVFEIRPARAFLAAAQAFIQTGVCIYLLTYCHSWWSLALGWFWAGTAAVGLFVIGHECAHGAFSTSPVISELVGTACMAPLSWPYNGWMVTHNHHHAYTNNLDKDHLWHPLMKETVTKLSKVVRDVLYYFYVGPLFFESSILHHLMHFNVLMFPKRHRAQVVRSCFSVVLVMGMIGHYLYTHGGWWAVFKYWLMPYLVFNFWLSTYTYFHHKSTEIGWIPNEKWNKAQAQLFHTAHVDYHPIFEIMHFDINWHIPHHVSVRIPWYNLRRATYALMQTYGSDLKTYEMSLSFWMEVTTQCHVHDDERNYLSIDQAVQESKAPTHPLKANMATKAN